MARAAPFSYLMNPAPYNEMSDLALLQLAIWREARGESYDGKRGVAHVIVNRSTVSSWWNHHVAGSVAKVILQPYQFSSFNRGDPNETKWPPDVDGAFAECCAVALAVTGGSDADLTNGATYYYDTSIEWPEAWGTQSEYENTLNIGRLRFWKPIAHSTPSDLDEGDL